MSIQREQWISIHALLAESDETLIILPKQLDNFYPRSPCGERRIKPIFSEINTRDFYPRSPCGERLTSVVNSTGTMDFYPRSPCGERRQQPAGEKQRTYFYPRSPCGERQITSKAIITHQAFLSTLSLRRATRLWTILYSCPGNFYPRSPCGERPEDANNSTNANLDFYPRSPCGERPP